MIQFSENLAYLQSSGATVVITPSRPKTSAVVKKIATALEVAPWGEDNRFPQNIIKELESSGVAQATLKWKAREYWGTGIVYGKVVDINANNEEVFKIAKRGEFKEVDEFWKINNIPLYFAENSLDFTYFANSWAELIFNKAGDKIAGLVSQEACDCRLKQMNDKGIVDTVYLSKLWGYTSDQFVKFDKNKKVRGAYTDLSTVTEVDGIFVKELPLANAYFPLDSAKAIQEKKKKSFILPISDPSPNKSYYQLASWDGCRQAGWIEISALIPEMLKMLYKNSYTIKCHIEIDHSYFELRFGATEWAGMDAIKRNAARNEILEMMDEFLTGTENAYKTFISYFGVDKVTGKEIGGIRITPLEFKNQTDKDLLTSGTANSEIMFSMLVNPNILGAGKPGGVYASNQGGSNIREGKIQHDSSQHLDRQLLLSPFNLIRDFNNWDPNLEFRFRDTVLTTLDTGKETKTEIK